MKKLTLHLGLHRCASTTVQNLLRENREVLADARVGVHLRRDNNAAPAFDIRDWYFRSPFNPRVRGAPRRLLHALEAHSADHLVISDENIIGLMPSLKSFRVYPGLGRFLSRIAVLRGAVDLQLRFVTRSPDRYLESIYAFRVSRGLTMNFDAFAAKFKRGAFSWDHLKAAVDAAGLTDNTQWLSLEQTEADQLAPALVSFLDLPALEYKTGYPGNLSLSKPALPLVLAMNKAEVMMDMDARKGSLLPKLAQADGVSPEGLTGLLDQKEIEAVKRHYNPGDSVGFDEESREAFLMDYRPR